MIKISIVGALVFLSGHAIWILSGINFIWLLVRDVTLFSWWIPVYCFIVFVLSAGYLARLIILSGYRIWSSPKKTDH